MKNSKLVPASLVAALVAGLVSGSSAAFAHEDSDTSAPAADKNSCKGQKESCKGQNSCKGKDAKKAAVAAPSDKNSCKGKDGCKGKTTDNN